MLTTWTWKDAEYIGCAPEHPDSKSPWCYIKGGLECGAGVKESKVTPGMFWKHCDSPVPPSDAPAPAVQPPKDQAPSVKAPAGPECQCSGKCVPEHPT
eukprot:UN21725